MIANAMHGGHHHHDGGYGGGGGGGAQQQVGRIKKRVIKKNNLRMARVEVGGVDEIVDVMCLCLDRSCCSVVYHVAV